MINAIRADLYRLFRSKGFYITQGLLIILVVSSILGKALGTSGVSVDQATLPMNQLGDLQNGIQDSTWNSYQATIAMSTMASFLMYFCLSLFVMIIGYDLTKKTYKNQITVGISRGYFFLSKYIIFLIVSALQFLFYYGFTFVTAGFRYGFGNAPKDFWLNILRTFCLQFFSFHAIFAIGLFFLFLTFSNVAGVIGVIVGSIIPSLFAALLSKYDWVRAFDFQTNLNSAWIKDIPDHYWLKVTFATLGFTTLLVLLSYQLFKKRNL